jgi:hypothetical protein
MRGAGALKRGAPGGVWGAPALLGAGSNDATSCAIREYSACIRFNACRGGIGLYRGIAVALWLVCRHLPLGHFCLRPRRIYVCYVPSGEWSAS